MKIKLISGRLARGLNLKTQTLACSIGLAAVLAGNAFAAGPYAPTNWPPTIDPSKQVHYCVIDGAFSAPNDNWTNTLSFVTGGDQDSVLAGCLQGFTGRKGISTYLNFRDTNWMTWSNVAQIDILMQVYGDEGVMWANGTDKTRARVLRAQEGSASPTSFTATSYPTNVYNFRWDWVLISVTNGWFTNSGTAYHLVGNLKSGSTSPFGGVNNGTIRVVRTDGKMDGFTIHAIAFGEAGAFGTTNDMNVFAPRDTSGPTCPPVPAANLVGIDFNGGTSNNLVVVSNVDAVLMLTNGVGPAGDQRTAVVPTVIGGGGRLYNFGVESNYLGFPCNPNAIVKVCVDFYDDPAYADWGADFGPEAYATDPQGCSIVVYPSTSLHHLTGTGTWIRRSWIIPNVNLYGVNPGTNYTGLMRLICKNVVFPAPPVAISRVEFGILRTGNDPLAGIDPLAGCALDPKVCQDAYTNYVELDLANNIRNGLDLGTPTTTQNWLTETVGPATDQRTSVCPDPTLASAYLQFQILNNALGPNYQDNARLAIVVTYYDDPALVGKTFGIDAWDYQVNGAYTIYAASSTKRITVAGTDKWRDAYWEIDRIDFKGVNQAPQAGPRFQCDAGAKIHVCRVRYAVIRTCGAAAGVNLLDSYRVTSLNVAPDTNGLLRLSWPYREPQLTVQSVTNLGEAWSLYKDVPILPESEQAVVRLAPTNSGSQFFRLLRPSIP